MLKNKIQNIFQKNTNGNSKKKIENLVVFLIILIITVIAINLIWNDEEKESQEDLLKKELSNVNNIEDNSNAENNLEEKLENILTKLNGVGKVNVLITYSESNQVIAMYNENSKESTTEEEDTSGGKRTIQEVDTSKDIAYKEENGNKIPVTEKIIMAKIEGAVIIAEGAKDASVKTNIVQAVEAVTGLGTHKIQVFEMKKN